MTYQRARIDGFMMHIVTCISITHPRRNKGHRQIMPGGDTQKWKDICMAKLGSDVYLPEKRLLKVRSVVEVRWLRVP